MKDEYKLMNDHRARLIHILKYKVKSSTVHVNDIIRELAVTDLRVLKPKNFLILKQNFSAAMSTHQDVIKHVPGKGRSGKYLNLAYDPRNSRLIK